MKYLREYKSYNFRFLNSEEVEDILVSLKDNGFEINSAENFNEVHSIIISKKDLSEFKINDVSDEINFLINYINLEHRNEYRILSIIIDYVEDRTFGKMLKVMNICSSEFQNPDRFNINLNMNIRKIEIRIVDETY